LHAVHGIAAAQRGLHILVEKPLEINTRRADALIEAAQKASVKLGVLFQDRTKADICKLKTWIADGVLGKILLFDARMKWYRPPEYYGDSNWRVTFALDGGGALINQCSHTVDLLLWLLGDVARIQARTAHVLHQIEVEDSALAILDFSSGAIGTLLATTAAYPGYPRRLEVTGTDGTVILEHDRIVAADLRGARRDDFFSSGGDANQSAASAIVNDSGGHQALLRNFLDAIRDDRPLVCDGVEGRRSVALIESIYRAARQFPPGSTESLS
jgi:predicted dehydrogenase